MPPGPKGREGAGGFIPDGRNWCRVVPFEKLIRPEAKRLGFAVTFFQSAHEGALVDKIHALTDRGTEAFIVNFGAYSHTSIALRDALASANLPAIEVHISDIKKREKFRHHSMTAGACRAMISGKGFPGYVEALQLLANM